MLLRVIFEVKITILDILYCFNGTKYFCIVTILVYKKGNKYIFCETGIKRVPYQREVSALPTALLSPMMSVAIKVVQIINEIAF